MNNATENDLHMTSRMESTTIKARSQELLQSGSYADCEFLVGAEGKEKMFAAHKLLLAIASPVFEAMLFGELSKEEKIQITDILPEAFQLLLNFVYTRTVDFKSVSQVADVYRAANKYLMSELLECCSDYLCMYVTADNVWYVLQLAVEYEDKHLKNCALQIVHHHSKAALESSSLETTTLETLESVLKEDNLNIDTEMILYEALLRWSKKECERRSLEETRENIRDVSGGALKKIRFLTMSSQVFADGPGDLSMLTSEEVYYFFMHKHSTSEMKTKSPININCKTRKVKPKEKVRHIQTYHLPLLSPQFYKSDGNSFLNEVCQFTVTSQLISLYFPTQTNKSFPPDYVSLQDESFDSSYREIMQVSLSHNTFTRTFPIDRYNPWNSEQKIVICELHENQVGSTCTCISVNTGDTIALTVNIRSVGWYPLILSACKGKWYKTVSSSSSETHHFLKKFTKQVVK